jgi:intein C-terminal splicing region
VYNFQVEDFHTYHVSGFGVLVHNAEYSPEKMQKIKARQKAGHEYEKKST